MRRYGRKKFVDAIWIHQRMNAKDARFARDMARRQALITTSLPPARYLVGDEVEVTNDAQVGEREVVLARGIIDAVAGEYPQQVYAVRGVALPQTAKTLRLVLRATCR